jgi:uncharacterized damage-inducible protein DinB
MTEHALPLSTFYQGWGRYQRMLVDVITPLSPAQLALPITSHHWTIGRTAQHMVANRFRWYQLWMGEGSADLRSIILWDPSAPEEPPARTAAELVTGLEVTWQLVHDALDHWTAADLADVFEPPASFAAEERQNFRPFTREWIIWHVFEHEIHHGGELSAALGNAGLLGIYGAR